MYIIYSPNTSLSFFLSICFTQFPLFLSLLVTLAPQKKIGNMNTLRSFEEMGMGSVVCPQPRQLGLGLFNNHIRPLRYPISYQSEIGDSSAVGEELLRSILPKESCYPQQLEGQVMAFSPPFFSGSPPSRVSNPVIQDEEFGNGNFSPFTSSPSSTSARGCVWMKFGHSPAAVRIEGFDSLSIDRSNCSISAVA